MTAAANVLGKRPDGEIRRYGLDPKTKVLHVVATKTGKLAFCGFEPKVIINPTLARARQIESRLDTAAKGYTFCDGCSSEMLPSPDPAIWGPPRPKDT